MRAPALFAITLVCLDPGGTAAAGTAIIAVDSVAVIEGNGAAATALTFTVTRAGDTASSVTLRYRTDDGTAVAPGDYTALASTLLTFAAGETAHAVAVAVKADAIDEPDETMFLHLTEIVGVTGAAASFGPAAAFAVGSAPAAVAAADVNGDGRQDLVAANANDASVSVRLGVAAPGGALGYAAPLTFAAGAAPAAIVVADVDGDGRADLAVANAGSDDVLVRLNTTAAGASAPSYGAAGVFAVGSTPRALAAADFDGDGRPDLAAANTGGDSVSVLLNTTAAGADVASFAAAATFAVGSNPRALATLDADADGVPDLAVANAGGSAVTLLLNTTPAGGATPDFAAAGDFAVDCEPRALTAADIDGDGRPDLAAACALAAGVSILLNTTSAGTPVVAYAAAARFAAGSDAAGLAAADFDGDGRADLAVADAGDGDVAVLINTTGAGAADASFVAASGFATGGAPAAVTAVDADGDGRADLALAIPGADSVAVLLNRPATFGASEGTGTIANDDDAAPDAFRFVDQHDVARNAKVTSAAVTLGGLGTKARISVAGGRYSIGCTNKFVENDGSVEDGDRVCVRHTSADTFSTATDTTLTVGGVSDTFTSVTLGGDTQPNPFAFVDVRDALMNSPQVSNAVRIDGFHDTVPLTVAGGEYSIGCGGAFATVPATLASGQTVCVRHLSSGSPGTATHTTLTVGGVSDTFTSTTPEPLDFSHTGALGGPGLLALLLGAGLARRRRRIAGAVQWRRGGARNDAGGGAAAGTTWRSALRSSAWHAHAAFSSPARSSTAMWPRV